METSRIAQFFALLSRHDVTAAAEHLAENVIIYSPIIPDGFKGKETAIRVLSVLTEVIDSLDVKELLVNGNKACAVLAISSGDARIDGMNFIALNPQGQITEMKIAWRPLASIVAVQQKIAPLINGAPLQLVPI